MEDTCKVCGKGFPDNPNKFHPLAPVYADDFVYHRECEYEVFEEVYQEV